MISRRLKTAMNSNTSRHIFKVCSTAQRKPLATNRSDRALCSLMLLKVPTASDSPLGLRGWEELLPLEIYKFLSEGVPLCTPARQPQRGRARPHGGARVRACFRTPLPAQLLSGPSPRQSWTAQSSFRAVETPSRGGRGDL